jgi:hypothetical protein
MFSRREEEMLLRREAEYQLKKRQIRANLEQQFEAVGAEVAGASELPAAVTVLSGRGRRAYLWV